MLWGWRDGSVSEKTYCSEFDYSTKARQFTTPCVSAPGYSALFWPYEHCTHVRTHTETHAHIRLLILWERKHAEISSALDKNLALACLLYFYTNNYSKASGSACSTLFNSATTGESVTWASVLLWHVRAAVACPRLPLCSLYTGLCLCSSSLIPPLS